jgi:hypothetical protein
MKSATKHMLVALLVLVFAHGASAQTVDEIVEKTIAALGGRAAHAKLKSRSMSGSIILGTPVGEVPGTIEILQASPNKARTLVKADLSSIGAGPFELDQRFDGKSGYVMDSLQGNREMSGNQLDNLRNNSFPHPLLNYKDQGTSAKLGEKEKVNDRDAFVITFEPVSGSPTRLYIDAETYLPIRSVIKAEVPQLGQQIEQTTDFLDYREVDGVKVAFQLKATSSVQNFAVKMERIEHNVPVDESLFTKPAK